MEYKADIKNYKPIIFLHIPKSAGVSLCGYLGQFYNYDENYFVSGSKYGTDEDKMGYHFITFLKFYNEIASNYKFISGHFNYHVAEKMIENFDKIYSEYAIITFLREPTLRVISCYNHFVKIAFSSDGSVVKYSNVPDEIYDLFTIKKISFEEFIEIYDNIQTKTLSNKINLPYLSKDSATRVDLDDAKINLRKFHFVGIYEELKISIDILSKHMLYNNTTFPRANVTDEINFKYEPPKYMQNIKLENLSNNTRNKLMLFNELDYELYYYARNIFNMIKKGDYSWRL